MKKSTKIGAVLAGIALAAVALTGCNPASNPGKGDRWYADTVQLPDGRHVTCVAAGGGGVDCDWEGAD